jgi:hypothetical protein
LTETFCISLPCMLGFLPILPPDSITLMVLMMKANYKDPYYVVFTVFLLIFI